jgi:universal stress protein E
MGMIVAATDLSQRGERAVQRGAELAGRLGAQLLVLHVVDDDQPATMISHETSDAESILAEMAEALAATVGSTPSVLVRTGHAPAVIAEVADGYEADVIVMGAHRRRLLADIFTGTTIERVIRAARRPVLMANTPVAGPHQGLVAAVDFSEPSKHAVREARRLGFLDGPRLVLLHAFTPIARDVMHYASVDTRVVQEHVSEESLRAREELVAFCRDVEIPPGEADLRIADGHPERVVSDVIAATDADLLVLGTRGASGLKRVLMGSVAERLLRTVEVDVLAVPSGD